MLSLMDSALVFPVVTPADTNSDEYLQKIQYHAER